MLDGGERLYIGAPPGIEESPQLVFAADCMEIAPGVTLYSDFMLHEPIPDANRGLLYKSGNSLVAGSFSREQIAEIREAE